MNKLFSIIASAAFLTLGATSCSEIKDGVNDIDQWEKPTPSLPVYDPQNYDLTNHPCMLHTRADIEYTKAHLGQQPWSDAYQKLITSGFCNTGYVAKPWVKLARLDADNWPKGGGRWIDAGLEEWGQIDGIQNSYMDLARDAAAAYQLALNYQLTGDGASAGTAIKIIEDWANINTGLLLGAPDAKRWANDVIDSNEYLIMFQIHQVANAAELLRDYNGWGASENFTKVVNWLKEDWYPFCHKFLEANIGNHWWLNWDLASMTAVLSIGILAEDNDMVNEAILRFKSSQGPGCIMAKALPAGLQEDPDGSGELLAQGNEAGRDQGHATLCAAMMGYFCQMALNIGEDLFSFEGGRAIAFAQYIAKYNLPLPGIEKPSGDAAFQYRETSLPFETYSYCGTTMTKISSEFRGTIRPGWDVWAGYCKSHNIRGKYVTEFAERYRPDGGAGHYGTNSGGFDQLGFSTLMFYRE